MTAIDLNDPLTVARSLAKSICEALVRNLDGKDRSRGGRLYKEAGGAWKRDDLANPQLAHRLAMVVCGDAGFPEHFAVLLPFRSGLAGVIASAVHQSDPAVLPNERSADDLPVTIGPCVLVTIRERMLEYPVPEGSVYVQVHWYTDHGHVDE